MNLYDNPPVESGELDVGDGCTIAWALHGDPNGKPAVALHGGPGAGRSRGLPRRFDPSRYRLVTFDQRGCGQSRPHAGDWSTSIEAMTTPHLVADIEKLREHLGIERWLVWGGSWGATLALAWATRHPDRVSEMILVSPTLTRRQDVRWFTRGARRFWPEAWERFAAAVPPDGDLARAYDRVVNGHPDPATRMDAVRAWLDWEDALLGHEGPTTPFEGEAAVAFARLVTHTFAHAAWLGEEELLSGAAALAGVPAVIVHGRLDLSGPPGLAWQLAKAWPGAELFIVNEGHRGGPEMERRMREAIERFGR